MNPVSTIPEGRPDEACLNIIKSHFGGLNNPAARYSYHGDTKRQTAVIYGVAEPGKLVTQMGAAQSNFSDCKRCV